MRATSTRWSSRQTAPVRAVRELAPRRSSTVSRDPDQGQRSDAIDGCVCTDPLRRVPLRLNTEDAADRRSTSSLLAVMELSSGGWSRSSSRAFGDLLVRAAQRRSGPDDVAAAWEVPALCARHPGSRSRGGLGLPRARGPGRPGEPGARLRRCPTDSPSRPASPEPEAPRPSRAPPEPERPAGRTRAGNRGRLMAATGGGTQVWPLIERTECRGEGLCALWRECSGRGLSGQGGGGYGSNPPDSLPYVERTSGGPHAGVGGGPRNPASSPRQPVTRSSSAVGVDVDGRPQSPRPGYTRRSAGGGRGHPSSTAHPLFLDAGTASLESCRPWPTWFRPGGRRS